MHGLLVEQLAQLPPPLPQLAVVVPAAQALPSQHPVQQLPAWQVPPLQEVPSVAAAVWQAPPTQLALSQGAEETHALQLAPPLPQWSLVLPGQQVAPSRQPSQHPDPAWHVPPHPSASPHLFPAQSGVQPEQLPPTQLPPAAAQSAQVAPPLPQVVSLKPATQLPSGRQQPTQLPGPQNERPASSTSLPSGKASPTSPPESPT